MGSKSRRRLRLGFLGHSRARRMGSPAVHAVVPGPAVDNRARQHAGMGIVFPQDSCHLPDAGKSVQCT